MHATHRFPRHRAAQRAFTLVETLVTTAVVVIVVTMSMAGFDKALKNRRCLKETAAAHKLIIAYLTAATDNDGQWLAGMDGRVKSITLPTGKVLNGHTCNRFPYRLGAYMEYNLDGTLLLKENSRQIEKSTPRGSGMYEYMVSTFPAFGMNVNFVGGSIDESNRLEYAEDCATRAAQTESPLLVFASAGGQLGNIRVDGFNILSPPHLKVANWIATPWTAKTNPALYGSVDARHDGIAVCAYTDGSVRSQTIEELRDMRLWSKNAAAQNDPNYMIP
ncbi:MAG: hypothetical protein B9S32_11655 [Verrucomicrobia bacterium Tous-C9LFEB]|nr:MAG: hypothetical protein B9S32_11655 [Verrucomicrobia bacterium Tous-C9LFEB]